MLFFFSLTLVPVFQEEHFTVYALNRYVQGGRVDILDSYEQGNIKKKKEYHEEFGKKMVRILSTKNVVHIYLKHYITSH